METSTLLPCNEGIQVEQVVPTDQRIVVYLRSVRSSARCPLCSQIATRLHSRYQRTLADLPWNRVAVCIQLNVGKFFCDHPSCQRGIFTEPVPELVARYAHKTRRLQTALYLIGYALGGEAGARLAVGLGLCVSPDTLLDRVRQVGTSATPQERVHAVGIDDWAFRKGRRYGTILVDLERRRVLDLLPERSAACLIPWLQAHPNLQVISRDRSGEYADGARQAAPQAIQVADRWHLVKNLAETLERLLATQQAALQEAASLLKDAVPLVWPPSKGATREAQSQQSRQKRQQLYAQVLQRYEQGASRRQIAVELGISRMTVLRYLRAGQFPERAKHKARPTLLDPYKAYLNQRFLDGCRSANQLYAEIKAQGYPGSASWASRYVSGLRLASEQPPTARAPAAAMVASLMLCQSDALPSDRKVFLRALCQKSPLIQTAYELAQQFIEMVRHRSGEQLPAWMEQATSSGLEMLMRFVVKLKQDLDAVTNGLTLKWSNGQTEGQVNRLKLIKRQMYGRAKFDLLRARVLPMVPTA